MTWEEVLKKVRDNKNLWRKFTQYAFLALTLSENDQEKAKVHREKLIKYAKKHRPEVIKLINIYYENSIV